MGRVVNRDERAKAIREGAKAIRSDHPYATAEDLVAAVIDATAPTVLSLAEAERRGAEKALREMADQFENGHVMDEPHSFRAANAINVQADRIAQAQP